jgi:hypothetical protein
LRPVALGVFHTHSIGSRGPIFSPMQKHFWERGTKKQGQQPKNIKIKSYTKKIKKNILNE